MSLATRNLRLNRFRYRQSRFGLIVPIDHGLTLGPVEGLKTVNEVERWIDHPAITGVIAHKGVVERLVHRSLFPSIGLMVHLNGMSCLAPTPDNKERLTSVETALRLGADGVSIQINFDGQNDAHNLQSLGMVVDQAQRYGLPVLTMLYDKVASLDDNVRLERLRHLMRITIELGTDAIKIAPPSRLPDIPILLDGLSEDAAIFFAGGSVGSDDSLCTLTQQAALHGAAGLCVGRNIFQRPSPGEILSRLQNILQNGERKPVLAQPLAPVLSEVKHGLH